MKELALIVIFLAALNSSGSLERSNSAGNFISIDFNRLPIKLSESKDALSKFEE